MGEIAFTKKICKQLENLNAMVIPYSASLRNHPHIPDRIIIHKYWMGFLEFKGENTALRPGQRIIIDRMNKRQPGSAFVIRAPGYVQDTLGNVLATFSDARELLQDLKGLQLRMQSEVE